MSPRDVLRRRLGANAVRHSWRSSRLSHRHRELYERYDDQSFLEGWYAQWFAFCDQFADRIDDNLLLIGDDTGSRIAPGSTWREEYAGVG